MSVLGWGKPRIIIKDLDAPDSKWEELPTPVENSTNLTPTKGNKQEAKVEGGENEDVRYSKNTYALTLQIRAAKGRKRPITDIDGVVTHNYAVVLQPEDATGQGFAIEKSTASVEDQFTAQEGGVWGYTFDALKPKTGNQVKWGVVKITESGGVISSIKLDPEGDEEEFEVATTE